MDRAHKHALVIRDQVALEDLLGTVAVVTRDRQTSFTTPFLFRLSSLRRILADLCATELFAFLMPPLLEHPQVCGQQKVERWCSPQPFTVEI